MIDTNVHEYPRILLASTFRECVPEKEGVNRLGLIEVFADLKEGLFQIRERVATENV